MTDKVKQNLQKKRLKKLIEHMNDLVRFFDEYYDDFGVKKSEFDRLNATTFEIIEDILNEDESNLLWSTYGNKITDLKGKIASLKTLTDDIQKNTSKLSYQIYQDSEKLNKK